ncbi:hypothetical protein [Streptomyces asoensis]|uniref:Uncharacterized protein n=1 Tax=Streptomyces asoensis TaxID=249586 RepID=A0ABQ3S5C4_9ACTN|nr:hypothetical protein [Streptomyces asoensis]GGQ64666.1 hypothetical protein GCM10010496_29990 [Streptomyces asoensis]GHI63319.1 hypothetical protein Saso_49690 [Streptomyces asoensis]
MPASPSLATAPPRTTAPASPATAPPRPAGPPSPATSSVPTSSVPTSPVPTASDADLGLEARLAAVDALMTLRLEEAAVAHEVRTAHLAVDPVDLAEVITVPIAPARQPAAPAAYRTPAAALLERAHHHMRTAGWCAGALTDDDGSVCLLGALHVEAGGDQDLVVDASAILLDAIRRRFHDESVPAFNDRQRSGAVPERMLLEAARLADARGR